MTEIQYLDPGLDAEQRELELEKVLTELESTPAPEPEQDLTPALFSPLDLQILLTNAYNWQSGARRDLFEAVHNLDIQKRTLTRLQAKWRKTDEYKALTNDKARDAYIAEMSSSEIALRDAAEDELNEARMYFEDASAEVEQARAMLRVAELAANINREK
jgi:hypothetical protein